MIFLFLLLQQVDRKPAAIFDDIKAAHAGVVADVVSGTGFDTPQAMIDEIMKENPARSWNQSDHSDLISYRSYMSGSGEMIIFHYPRANGGDQQEICRIHAWRDPFNSNRIPAEQLVVSYRAQRWCYAHFGVTLPPQPSPPIIQRDKR
jgi:hypothetical protein